MARGITYTYAGVDVSAKKLDVAFINRSGEVSYFAVPNTAVGRQDLIRQLGGGKVVKVKVCIEATGAYSLDLHADLALATNTKVMVVPPQQARHFAQSIAKRAKTDRVDALVLAEYAKRMEFRETPVPDTAIFEVRALARRLADLVQRQTALKNKVHAADSTARTPPSLRESLKRELDFVAVEIASSESAIKAALSEIPDAKELMDRVLEITGFGPRAVAQLLPELLALPKELTAKSVAAHAGLDPRPRQSGSSLNPKSWHISKMGNSHLRAALFMPAMTAVRHMPEAKEFHRRISERSGSKLVGVVAVMRKLITAVWSMRLTGQRFESSKFAQAA